MIPHPLPPQSEEPVEFPETDMPDDKDLEHLDEATTDELSDCCGWPITITGFCTCCHEHAA